MTFSFEATLDDFGCSTFEPDAPRRIERDPSDTAPPETPDAPTTPVESPESLRARAFESGRAAGLAEARTQCEPALRALAAAADELVDQRRDYLCAQRRLIVDLAVLIAEHVLERELEAHPEIVLERIGAALSLTTPHQDVVVELNPSDLEMADAAKGTGGLPENLRLVENGRLAAGEFVLTDTHTTVDARLASIVEDTRRALEGLETLSDGGAAPDGGDAS